jgi:hypothetical protein
MRDHILKQTYPQLQPAAETAIRGISSGLSARVGNALGIYSGDVRIVPMLQGSTASCYRAFVSQGNLNARWMNNIENAFQNDNSWRPSPSTSPTPTPVIRDTAKNTVMFVYGNYAIELSPMSNDHESIALYRGYGEIGRVHTEMIRALGLDYDENGWYLPVVINGVQADRIKLGAYLSEALYATGINSNRYSSNNYLRNTAYRNIVASKYFSKEIFTEEVMARLADCEFFQGLLQSPEWANATNQHDFSSSRAPWITHLKKSYAHHITQVEAMVRREKRKSLVLSKFSDTFISEAIGQTTAEEIKAFREKMLSAFKSPWDFESFILSSDKDTIRSKMTEVMVGNHRVYAMPAYDMETSFARLLPTAMVPNLDTTQIHQNRGFKYRITNVQNAASLRNPRMVVSVEFVETPPEYRNLLHGASRSYVTTDYSVYYTG